MRRPTHKRIRNLRKEIALERGAICAMCSSTRDELTLDHILPLSRGGSNEKTNLQLLCVPCHREKDGLPPQPKKPKSQKKKIGRYVVGDYVTLPDECKQDRFYYPKKVGAFWTLVPRPSKMQV